MRCLLLFGMMAQAWAAEPTCAVRVFLLDSLNQPANGARVSIDLLDPRGTLVRSDSTHSGKVEFCDFGLGPHSILIGKDTCLPVSVHDVRARPGRTQNVFVRLNSCPHPAGPLACSIYLRARSTEDLPIVNAKLSISGTAIEIDADQFGRLAAALLPASTALFSIQAPGYRTETVELGCQAAEDIDRLVVMRRLPSKNGQ